MLKGVANHLETDMQLVTHVGIVWFEIELLVGRTLADILLSFSKFNVGLLLS